ncbi:MAG TPA: Ig-like domain-containing protein, partial [Candidatus Binatia bacterium]|nr:Ig-like domain-containing protein [Candidatus Binatia bacterium]
MKTILAVWAVFLTVFLAATMTGGQQPGDLQVIYNLSGNLNDLENKELIVTFSDDMLPLGGNRDGASLVRITPTIQGRFNWRGNRTLAFKPEPRFRFSSTYTAVVPAGTRSLAGKVLAKEIRWQWSTPQAYPVEIKTAGREYFSSLRRNEKLDFAVWVNDPLTLRFEQKVAAGEAGSFFSLRDAKNNEPVAIQIFQKAADELEIRFAQNLKRGILYQFIIKKGFCGSEGRTGTAKDFDFSFDTIADFVYSGNRELLIFPDSPYCWLTFSNALAEIDPAIIRIFRVQEGKSVALKFSLESRYYENSALLLRVEEELASGDELSIRVERSLANLHKETLRENLNLKGRVCSSRSPRIGFSMPGKNFSMTAKSIKKASVRSFKFSPDFYSLLERNGYGILQQRDFAARFIQKEIKQNLENLPEKTNTQNLPDHELGSALGFFGFLIERYEPFNVCMDARILRHPVQMPPLLQVFHRRNMDLVVKAGQGQTLYWLYDNRSGRALGGKPLFLRGSGEAEALGATAANGVLLNDRVVSQSNLVMARNPENNDMTMVRIDRQPVSDREMRISVFSDRDFYKPGDTVHIGGIIKEYASGKVSSPKTIRASIEISGPDWQKVISEPL